MTVVNGDANAIPAGLDGLSSLEAQQRLAQFGPNRWVKRDRFARARDLIRLLLDPMALMLLTAAVIYFLLGETRDALVLAIALIPVLGVDVVLEARSRAALDKLARAAAPLAEVVRQNQIRTVPYEEIVPGDILVLREGHTLAADGVVRWAANLAADESSLTGESVPQSKREWLADPAEAPGEARFFAGSQVLSGHGFGYVTTTGTATHYGGIAALVAATPSSASPLQRQVGALVRSLGIVAGIVAIGLFALSLQRGEPWTRALLGAVSLAMAAIPEEFPIVLTLFLSVGAWRLASHGMLVRHLASVETLGSTTVICTDKTGTLTRGEFQMTHHLVLAEGLPERDFLELAVLACEQHPTDAMERAIVSYAEAHQVSALEIATRFALVRDYDFDPVGKHMSHVWKDAGRDDSYRVASKGALEGILAHTLPETREGRDAVEANSRLAAQGLRVLALAGRRTSRLGADRDEDERGLMLYGLLGFADPLRPEVPAAVAECQRAGIRIIMITGDHALTAHAVAEAVGIVHDDQAIVTGDELARLDVVARDARIRRAAILARISPEQKHIIINALQRTGEIVAMTGDGVNDAPALHRADIGIAMGRRGTDVARATADLVLLDDNFASIVTTVRLGRHIFQNIQRAFLYLIGFHIPIIVLAVSAPLAGLPLLLLPIHLVWLELIVHPVSAIVFQVEPAAADIMSRPPRRPEAPLLARNAVLRSSASGVLLAAASLATYWTQWTALGEAQARGLALIVLIAGYQTLVFAERRALPTRAMALLPRAPVFWIAWFGTAFSLAAILFVPALSDLFKVERSAAVPALAAVSIGVLSVAWRLVPVSIAVRALAVAVLSTIAVGTVAASHSPTSIPDPPDVDSLLQHLDDLYRSKSSIARMQIDVTSPRSTRSMRIKAWTRGEEEVLVLIESPPREAGTATLRVGNNLWNYLPKIARTVRVPPAAMLGSWMGTDFTNDDLVKESSLRKDFAARIDRRSDTPPGWWLVLEVKAGIVGRWSRIEVLISDARLPIEERHFDRKGRLARTMHFDDIRVLGGRRLPARMALVPADAAGQRTEMRYLDLQFDVALPNDTFSLSRLEQVR